MLINHLKLQCSNCKVNRTDAHTHAHPLSGVSDIQPWNQLLNMECFRLGKERSIDRCLPTSEYWCHTPQGLVLDTQTERNSRIVHHGGIRPRWCLDFQTSWHALGVLGSLSLTSSLRHMMRCSQYVFSRSETSSIHNTSQYGTSTPSHPHHFHHLSLHRSLFLSLSAEAQGRGTWTEWTKFVIMSSMIIAMLHSDPWLLIQTQCDDGIEFFSCPATENKRIPVVINTVWSSGDPWGKMTYLIEK